MKIALITPEFITDQKFDGGLATYTHRLSQSLLQLGHEPVVIVSSNKAEVFKRDGVEVHYVDVMGNARLQKKLPWINRWKRLVGNKKERFYQSWIPSFSMNDYIRTLHAQKPFDILHYSHLNGLAYHVPKNIPSVIRISSSTRLCHERGGYGQSDAEMVQQEKAENKAMKRVTSIFGPSRMIASYITNQIKRPIEIIETPFLLNVENLDNSEYDKRLQGKKYFLFYGSLTTLKGVETIAATLEELLSSDPDLHFAFVGKVLKARTGQDMLEYILEKAGSHKDRVIHCPPLRQPQLYPIVQNAEAVILPSLVDNFPNTCIEAMAFGRVVVGTSKNGFEQLIDHGKSGYLVGIDKSDELLQTMKDIQGLSIEQKKEIGKHAAERIKDLEPEKVVKQLVAFYESVIQKHKK